MDTVWSLDEKNGVICLVVKFTPRVMVIKIKKMAHFLYFSADDSKKVVTVLAKDLSALERYHQVFSKTCMVNSLWSYCLPDIGGRNIKKTDESKNTEILFFQEFTCY